MEEQLTGYLPPARQAHLFDGLSAAAARILGCLLPEVQAGARSVAVLDEFEHATHAVQQCVVSGPQGWTHHENMHSRLAAITVSFRTPSRHVCWGSLDPERLLLNPRRFPAAAVGTAWMCTIFDHRQGQAQHIRSQTGSASPHCCGPSCSDVRSG